MLRRPGAPLPDPLLQLAEKSLERAVADWLDLRIQLMSSDGALANMMSLAFRDGVTAMAELAKADPENPKQIRMLQNRIQLFEDHVHLAQEIMQQGVDSNNALKQMKEQGEDMVRWVDADGRFEFDETEEQEGYDG